ncbi:MAG TPA: hypothetical protein VLZ54_04050 [Arenibacter sp.]|nr:hypothetical protein [Arenibacter sp.]
MDKQKLPIGFYLKKVDNLLTTGIHEIHSEMGLSRTDWQILNIITDNDGLDRPAIIGIVSEFANDEAINNTISGLIKNGLLQEDNSLTLTGKGKDTHLACLQKQILFRQKSMRNITHQEYLQVIATLDKIITNLK